MINYPIFFYAKAESKSGINTTWNIESQSRTNVCAIPPEFEGPGGGFSPEDLFAQALTNCFIATFKVYAEKSKINFKNLEVKTELIANLSENKKPIMKNCKLIVKIFGCENLERTKTIAEKAFNSGFIINSVKTEMELDLTTEC
jgi:organic hydroperoxide reductase OsmC/OhrA